MLHGADSFVCGVTGQTGRDDETHRTAATLAVRAESGTGSSFAASPAPRSRFFGQLPKRGEGVLVVTTAESLKACGHERCVVDRGVLNGFEVSQEPTPRHT